ncbi:MAG: immunoglobulin domain-containing protein, partial [Solobacterium sp.]|nr:immunoglobulin domain-containing protein [Solobacterium sp.]
TYHLPVTWYKGYQVYKDNEPLAAEPGLYRLVSFEAAGPGTYTCRYSGTLLQKTSLALSLISTAVLILLKLRRCAV